MGGGNPGEPLIGSFKMWRGSRDVRRAPIASEFRVAAHFRDVRLAAIDSPPPQDRAQLPKSFNQEAIV